LITGNVEEANRQRLGLPAGPRTPPDSRILQQLQLPNPEVPGRNQGSAEARAPPKQQMMWHRLLWESAPGPDVPDHNGIDWKCHERSRFFCDCIGGNCATIFTKKNARTHLFIAPTHQNTTPPLAVLHKVPSIKVPPSPPSSKEAR
jgi:hypothetical protein